MSGTRTVVTVPFNGPLEVGLRSLCILTSAYPLSYSLQRLVILDYVVVHSDDIPGGPPGLHPQTPHRSNELLVRREPLQEGLLLFQSRRLVEKQYMPGGVFYSATERSAGFLDSLDAGYVSELRDRAGWSIDTFGSLTDDALAALTNNKLGQWGAEFVGEPVLWSEELT